MTEEDAWSHVAWDEREVGTVVAIEHGLRTCSTNGCYERVVVIWVTAEDVGCGLVGTVHRHDVGEVLMCIADGSTEVGDLSASCPVA